MSQTLDRFLLALCVWREARGESTRGKELVAQTVINRAHDSAHRWPQTIADVILQPMQFSSFNGNDPNSVKFPQSQSGLANWEECVTVADRILASPTPITDANHYHVEGLHPAWRDDSKIVAHEGAHVFYRL